MLRRAAILGLFVFAQACAGSATQNTSKADREFEALKTEISKTPGDATGTKYSGTFDVAIAVTEGKRECWGSDSVRQKVEAGPVPEKATLNCTQTDGSMDCTYTKLGLDVKGVVHASGTFGLYGEFSRTSETNKSSTKGEVVMKATYSDEDHFTGKFLTITLTTIEKNSAFCTYAYPVAGVRSEASAAAAVTLSIDQGTYIRRFTDFQKRTVEGELELGGKRSDTERFTARLHNDGTADVTARIVDADGEAKIEGVLLNCSYEKAVEDNDPIRITCVTTGSL